MLSSINLWPPFLGAGIRVKRIQRDMTAIDVEMDLRFWNANYVGTHYGGSLYSMTDPFYMLMVMERLGEDYIVWDKAACIRFKRPGKGIVRAEFRLSEERLEEIRENVGRDGVHEPRFTVQVRNTEGQVVAEVEKVLHIRKKPGR